jgi:hypothetical protein
MKFVIKTQYMENYGYRWKYKGGQTIIITDCPDLTPSQQEELVALADKRLTITYTNEASKEYILSFELLPDEWVSEFEQDQLNFEGEIRFKDPRYTYFDITEGA